MTLPWIKRAFLASVFSLSAAACGGGGDSAEVFCETLVDCLGAETTVSACIEEVDDAVSDGRIDSDDLDNCADCLGDNTCAEIQDGDCSAACDTTEPTEPQ